MHQTTVRFGPDLWQDIEIEARQAGVSVAQYVRDSALMRVAYTRGREGDAHYEAAREATIGGKASQPKAVPTSGAREEAAALRAETQQARRQARAIREQGRQLRKGGATAPPGAAEPTPRA